MGTSWFLVVAFVSGSGFTLWLIALAMNLPPALRVLGF